MTLSIIARCARTGQFGVAATTSVPAVGKLLAHAAPRVGAVATQGKLNPYLGIDGLSLLKDGHRSEAVIETLISRDDLAERRQLAVLDADGRAAVWTGAGCKDWAGSFIGSGFSVQGNRLTGGDVIERAVAAFGTAPDDPLVSRLIDALDAGLEQGGDRLGEFSAAVYIVEQEDYPLWDIRVDHHANPIAELRRLREVFEAELVPHIRRMPKRQAPGVEEGDYDV